MKKRLLMLLAVVVLLAGCGSTDNKNTEAGTQQTETESSATSTDDATSSEEIHSHVYTEAITVEVSCETNGEKTFTCECGDSYTEPITATGHKFEGYTYNQDATYTADGTETATCICGLTDTRTASGTKLTYTYTDLDKTMYAKSSVNVRSLPTSDGEKLGGLSKAQEVHVTGQCNETNWYRIEYNGDIGYVSNNYLQDSKPVEEVATQPSGTGSTQNEVCPYELYVVYYDNQGYPYFYGIFGGSANMDADNWAKTSACLEQADMYMYQNYTIMNEDGTWSETHAISWQNIGVYNGAQIVVRYVDGVNGVGLSSPETRGIPTAGNGSWD